MSYLKFGTSLLAIAAFFCVGYRATEIYRNNNSYVSTNGVSDRIVTSDEAVLTLTITNDADAPKDVAEKRKHDKKIAMEFLKQNGIKESEIDSVSCDISERYRYKDDPADVKKYNIYDKITVKSKHPEKVEKLGEKISDLVDSGLCVSSTTKYYYKDMVNLRVEMIEEAAKDSMNRAKHIADIAGVHVSGIKNFSTGAFSISPENISSTSNEEWSADYSLKKRVRVVVHGSYDIG